MAAGLLVSGTLRSTAYAASLDPAFGVSGVAVAVELQDHPGVGPARKVALAPGGSLTAIGNDTGVGSQEMVEARFTAAGLLDPLFGTDGWVYSRDFRREQPIGFATDIALGRDGRIISTGPLTPAGTYNNNTFMCFFVSRQLSNGSLDRKFAYNGRHKACIHKSNFTIGLDSGAMSLTGNGNIVVAGAAHHSALRVGALVAVVDSGGKHLVRSFKGSKRTRLDRPGLVEILPPKPGYAEFTDVKALRNGQVLAGGYYNGKFMAARFRANGSLDSAFARNGLALFDLDGDPDWRGSYSTAMVTDRNGRIILAGYTDSSEYGDADARLTLVRLTRSGKLDRTFGTNGIAKIALDEYYSPEGHPDLQLQQFLTSGITLQKDGKIAVSGQYNRRYSLVRLNPNGKLDKSFFDNGVFVDWVLGSYGSAWDVITDQKGRLVTSGGTSDGGFVLMRFLPESD